MTAGDMVVCHDCRTQWLAGSPPGCTYAGHRWSAPSLPAKADEQDWRTIADVLATELRKHGWGSPFYDVHGDVCPGEQDAAVAAALTAYDYATGAVDAEMAREFHAAIVAILESRDLDGNVDETADAILEEFGLVR